MWVFAGRTRISRDLASAVIERDLGPVPGPRRLHHRKFGVELRKAGRGSESELTARHWQNVEVGDLVEAASKQPAGRIGWQRLELCTGGKQNDEDEEPRRCKPDGWTQRRRHRGTPRNPRGNPPDYQPASA